MYLYAKECLGQIPAQCQQIPPADEWDSVVSAIRSLPEAKTCPTLAHAAEHERRIVDKLRKQGFSDYTIEAGLRLLRKEIGLPAPQCLSPITGPRQTSMRAPEPGELIRNHIYTAQVLEEMFRKAERSDDVKGMAEAAEMYYELLNAYPSQKPGKPMPGRLAMERQRKEIDEARTSILRQAPTLASFVRNVGPFELASMRRKIGEYVRQRVLTRQQRRPRARR